MSESIIARLKSKLICRKFDLSGVYFKSPVNQIQLSEGKISIGSATFGKMAVVTTWGGQS